ncbi:DUF2946 family protein [Shimia sp.]|uniref:DUF2946 family protein n=1 Tax=Shimia sp. TaxID=1954381 RepID=UPI003299B492
MRANAAHDTRSARRGFAGWHAVSVALATLALLMQLVVPSLVQAAVANGASWIEICSEAGAVWIEVAEEDTPDASGDTPKHSECRDCSLCAVASYAADPSVAKESGPAPAYCVHVVGAGRRIFLNRQYERPLTRGPPIVAPDNVDRAQSAFPAPIFQRGGAL